MCETFGLLHLFVVGRYFQNEIPYKPFMFCLLFNRLSFQNYLDPILICKYVTNLFVFQRRMSLLVHS